MTLPSQERLIAVIELQNAIAASSMGAEDVMRIAAERAGTLTGAPGVIVALTEGEDLVYRAAHGSTKPQQGNRIPMTSTLGVGVTERKVVREDGRLGVPLLYGEHAVGVLEIAAGPNAYSEADVETLRLLATIISIALHRAHSYPRPRMDQTHDALTGLENRRAFDERVAAELTRNKRYGQTFSLALIDLDGLEDANDRLGQAAGDQILRDIATILKAHTRVIDAVFRLGGDDFAIVMPGTAEEGAKILSERCRTHIIDAKLADSITASFGVVEAAGETAPELVQRATDALAADKRR